MPHRFFTDIDHDYLLESNESIGLGIVNCGASAVKSVSGSSNVTSGSQIQNTTDAQDCESAIVSFQQSYFIGGDIKILRLL